MAAFCSNLERKFELAIVGMKTQPIGAAAGTEAQESAAARQLVHQVKEALESAGHGDGGTRAAVAQQLVHQAQEAQESAGSADDEHSLLGGTPEAALKLQELEAAQAAQEHEERIANVYAALKATDVAESSTPAPASVAKVQTMDERIAALQQMAAQSKLMMREQAALADAMTALGAELAAERSGIATPATPVALGVESQHALLHASPRITCESLASGRVEPVAQDCENCGVCTATKMRAASVRQHNGPQPATDAAAHVCASSEGSAGASGEAASSE